jgi:hypothetical protein
MRADLKRLGTTRRVVTVTGWMVPTIVAITLVASGCGVDTPNTSAGRTDPLQDVPEPTSTPPDMPPSAGGNGIIVTITDTACVLDASVTRIRGRRPSFEVVNETDGWVAFDIGKLADGHTFAELRTDIQDAMEGPQSGDPVAERPKYFRGSITGDRTHSHGGMPGPSLLQIGPMWGGTMTWSFHPTRYERMDTRGTWAVICYRESGRDERLEQIGVVGPLEYGWVPPSAGVYEDSFVDLRTGEATPLPDPITSIPGASNYRVSPDGSLLLFDTHVDLSTMSQIYVADVDGGGVRQLTNDPEGAVGGSWSADGATVVCVARWSRSTDMGEDVALALVDVATHETALVEVRLGDHFIDPHLSPDGGSIQFSRWDGLWSIPVRGGTPRLEVGLKGLREARYSPDGMLIAFGKTGYWQAGHGGGSFGEIWLANADGSHPRHLVGDRETSLGEWAWSPNGTRLAAIDVKDEVVIIIDVSTERLRRLGVHGWSVSWFDDDTVIVDAHER